MLHRNSGTIARRAADAHFGDQAIHIDDGDTLLNGELHQCEVEFVRAQFVIVFVSEIIVEVVERVNRRTVINHYMSIQTLLDNLNETSEVGLKLVNRSRSLEGKPLRKPLFLFVVPIIPPTRWGAKEIAFRPMTPHAVGNLGLKGQDNHINRLLLKARTELRSQAEPNRLAGDRISSQLLEKDIEMLTRLVNQLYIEGILVLIAHEGGKTSIQPTTSFIRRQQRIDNVIIPFQKDAQLFLAT